MAWINPIFTQAIERFGKPVTEAIGARTADQAKIESMRGVLQAELQRINEQRNAIGGVLETGAVTQPIPSPFGGVQMQSIPVPENARAELQATMKELDSRKNYLETTPVYKGLIDGTIKDTIGLQAAAGVKYPVAEKPKYEIEFGDVGNKKGYVVTKDGVPVKERLEETTSGGAGGTSLQSEAEKIYLSQYNKNFEKYFEPLKNKYGLRNVNLSDIMLSISDIKGSKERTQKLKSIVKKRTNTNLSDEDAVALQNQYNADYDTAMYNAQQSALDTMEEGYYYDYLSKERKASHVKGTTNILSGTLEG